MRDFVAGQRVIITGPCPDFEGREGVIVRLLPNWNHFWEVRVGDEVIRCHFSDLILID